MLDSYVHDYDEIRVKIDKEYLVNSAERFCAASITDEDKMMEYFVSQIDDISDDCLFNRFVDSVFMQAFEEGEEWIKSDE